MKNTEETRLKNYKKWEKLVKSEHRILGDLGDINCLLFEINEKILYRIGITFEFGNNYYIIKEENEGENIWLCDESEEIKDLSKWVEKINKEKNPIFPKAVRI